RYQLTAVGAPGPNLYIAETMQDGHFGIAGGTPGGTVSWQGTGIRQEPWADAHRIPGEQEKSGGERGRDLNPELYGMPPSASMSGMKGTPAPMPTKTVPVGIQGQVISATAEGRN